MIKQFANKQFLLPLFLLIGLYFITRLPNLTIIPIFTDEAIYLRWSQIGTYDAAWRFIPLVDGKPPLYHWFVMLTIRIFSDPLVAGRLVSVASGFVSMLLLGVLSQLLLANKRITLIAMLLYILSPFMHLYDRLAIVDSLLTTTSIASLAGVIWLLKSNRLDSALILGGAIGAGMLTKASGLLFLLLAPVSLIQNLDDPKQFLPKAVKFILLLSVSAVVAQLIYSILRLSEFFYRIGQKNHEFIVTFSEFFASPFSMTWGNAKSLFTWQLGYLTLPVILLIIFAFAKSRYFKEKTLLLLYYLIPFVIIASFNKIIFPRFLLFSTPFLLIIAAIGLDNIIANIKSQSLKAGIFFLVFLIPSITIFHLITDPAVAAIPQADRDQYWDSWPAGHGINQTIEYLNLQATTQPIFIGTQGTFGLFPYSLELYLLENPNITIQSYWPVSTVPDEVLSHAQTTKTFFIYNELEEIPPQPNLELILEFKKQRGDEIRHMRLFEVKPITK